MELCLLVRLPTGRRFVVSTATGMRVVLLVPVALVDPVAVMLLIVDDGDNVAVVDAKVTVVTVAGVVGVLHPYTSTRMHGKRLNTDFDPVKLKKRT